MCLSFKIIPESKIKSNSGCVQGARDHNHGLVHVSTSKIQCNTNSNGSWKSKQEEIYVIALLLLFILRNTSFMMWQIIEKRFTVSKVLAEAKNITFKNHRCHEIRPCI